MALSDWTQQINAGSISITTNSAKEGSQSLRLSSANNTQVITNDKSETDAPAEGEVRTWIKTDNVSLADAFGIVFRYQDTDNFYGLAIDADEPERIELIIRENGSYSTLDGQVVSFNFQDNDTADYTFIFWENTASELSGRVLRNGSQLGADVTDPNNKFADGGAIGLAKFGAIVDERANHDYDETELLY